MPNRSRQELLDLCVFLFPRKGKKKKKKSFLTFASGAARRSLWTLGCWSAPLSSVPEIWVIWLFAGFGKPLPALLHHLPTRTSSRPAAGATRHNRPPKKLRFYIRPPGDSCYPPPPSPSPVSTEELCVDCWRLVCVFLCKHKLLSQPLSGSYRNNYAWGHKIRREEVPREKTNIRIEIYG